MVAGQVAAQVFLVLCWLLALGWLWQAVAALRGVPSLPDLTGADGAALPALPAGDEPDLTVIVPACNEGAAIKATLRSLLASTGLRLEIIAVDDRSTDRTGELMDAVAAEARAAGGPHGIEVIHNRALPPGWLGKPHAMHLAAERATAPWLLFTDGDVLFDPRALELGLRYALGQKADHVVLGLTLILETLGEAAMLAAMSVLSQWNIRLWKVTDPRARDFFGAGGFNLVRREVFDRLGGFEALRMEVLEDLRLGWKIKRAGYAQRFALGPGLVRIRWLRGALGVVRLIEKNGFALYRYRTALALLACLGLAVQVVLPLAALVAGGWATAAGVVACASIVLAYFANRRISQVSPWVAVFFAPASGIVLFAVLRSILLTLARNGVEWRGTRYPLDELRRHAGREW
ncbi:MAG TPA: glycosyltransferase family 2 protein [Terracidiphilus sp.]|nr:glycosyltransferase family 2 protein [Terracidiphilus sp.]